MNEKPSIRPAFVLNGYFLLLLIVIVFLSNAILEDGFWGLSMMMLAAFIAFLLNLFLVIKYFWQQKRQIAIVHFAFSVAIVALFFFLVSIVPVMKMSP